jgi:hypothetical protein
MVGLEGCRTKAALAGMVAQGKAAALHALEAAAHASPGNSRAAAQKLENHSCCSLMFVAAGEVAAIHMAGMLMVEALHLLQLHVDPCYKLVCDCSAFTSSTSLRERC